MYSCALDNYILYVKNLKDNTYRNTDSNNKLITPEANIRSQFSKIIDYDILIEIKPHIISNRLLSAAQIVVKNYQDKYPNLGLSDWLKILKDINYSEDS